MGRPSASKKAKVEDSTGVQMKELERKRRGRMNSFYSDLHSMVPNLSPKATKASIIDGTISYIQELENRAKELEARKDAQLNTHDPSLQTLIKTSSSVEMTVSGSSTTIFFGIRSPAGRPGLANNVIRVFEAHKAEVLSVSIAGGEKDGEMTMMVTASIDRGDQGGEAGEVIISEIKKDLLMCLSC